MVIRERTFLLQNNVFRRIISPYIVIIVIEQVYAAIRRTGDQDQEERQKYRSPSHLLYR